MVNEFASIPVGALDGRGYLPTQPEVPFVTRVMTVDDEIPIQELYEAVLGLAGCDLAGQAFDGQHAVDMYREAHARPDLIIMDYRMPVLDGLEATREILAIDRTARIVFISADGSVERHARELGAVGFLLKPFPLAHFIALMKSFAAGGPPPTSATAVPPPPPPR